MKWANNSEDDALIRLFYEGHQPAFEKLLQRHQRRLFLTVFRLIRDRHRSEDLLQEVFIKIYKALQEGRYRNGSSFSSWVLRITRNHCLDHLKSTKHGIVVYMEVLQTNQPYEESMESSWINEQNSQRVRSLVTSLPRNQQTVITYRFYKGMKFKEIAVLTDCSINTVQARMRYALAKMRKLMMQEQPGHSKLGAN